MVAHMKLKGILGITFLAIAVLSMASISRAIEVKKSLYSSPGTAAAPGGGGPAPKDPISAAMKQKLSEMIAAESESFMGGESEKKASGQPYTDLEAAKFKYIPQMKDGKVAVTAKLEGAEYRPAKTGAGKGTATGKHRTLVFAYKLDNGKWVEGDQPKWEETGGAVTGVAAKK